MNKHIKSFCVFEFVSFFEIKEIFIIISKIRSYLVSLRVFALSPPFCHQLSPSPSPCPQLPISPLVSNLSLMTMMIRTGNSQTSQQFQSLYSLLADSLLFGSTICSGSLQKSYISVHKTFVKNRTRCSHIWWVD